MKFTIENYEEYALDYLEGNLNKEDQNEYAAFLLLHPDIKESFEDFQMVTLPAAELTFPDKEKLLRKELPGRKILPLFFRAIAAAILVLLLINLWVNDNRNSDQGQIAKINDLQEEKIDITSENKKTISKEQGQKSETDLAEHSKTNPDPAGQKELNRILPEKKLARTTADPVELTSIGDDLAANLDPHPKNTEISTVIIQPVVFIQKIDIHPEIAMTYQIEHRPTYLIIEDEKKEDAVSKISRLLAKANLIPTGLTDEISDIDIREKIIPESYIDLK